LIHTVRDPLQGCPKAVAIGGVAQNRSREIENENDLGPIRRCLPKHGWRKTTTKDSCADEDRGDGTGRRT
jgi:hypothetical protein